MSEVIDALEVDKLKLYLGFDYTLNSYITVKQPTIRQIAERGEKEYYGMVYTLCGIPSDAKSKLWDAGIDWNKISDFEFFVRNTRNLTVEDTSILLGDLDLSTFIPGRIENDELILYKLKPDYVPQPNKQPDLYKDCYVIDEFLYERFIRHIRFMHNITPKVEHAGNKFTRDFLIDEDRENLAKNANKPYSSKLLSLISGMVNSPGFSYKIDEVLDLGIYQFMDSVKRIRVVQSADAFLHGLRGGMLDTSKTPQSKIENELNIFKDL